MLIITVFQPAEVLSTRASSQPQAQQSAGSSPNPNPKHQYGGLIPAQQQGARAYTDAATYNQHLNQQQSYTAQAQAAPPPIRNPYAQPQTAQSQVAPQQQQSQRGYDSRKDYSSPGIAELPQHAPRLQHQSSSGTLGSTSSYPQVAPPAAVQYTTSGLGSASNQPPVNSYYPSQRGRANTTNQPDHAVPPALARIANMHTDVSGIKRNTLTPVLNREEAILEWERRASGQKQPPGPAYPQLEYLQQQAELAASNWNSAGASSGSRRYQPSSLSHFQSPPSAVTTDTSSNKHHRDQSMSMGGMRDISMGSLSRPTTGPGTAYDQGSAHLSTNLPPPPQAYSGGSSSGRYGTSTSSYQQGPSSPYDAYDQRDGLGTLYTPMQPTSLSGGGQQSPYVPGGNGNGAPSANAFYGGGVVSTPQTQSRNRTTQQQGANPPPQSYQSDNWNR